MKVKYGADDYLLRDLHSKFVHLIFFFIFLSAVVETCQKFQFFNCLVVPFWVVCDEDKISGDSLTLLILYWVQEWDRLRKNLTTLDLASKPKAREQVAQNFDVAFILVQN